MFEEKQPAPRFWSACEGGSTCVEVASFVNLFLVRDSKDSDGPVLAFSRVEWREFVAGVKRGEFDFGRAAGRVFSHRTFGSR
jgi:hypothetical protein